jgi:hypothetical protein
MSLSVSPSRIKIHVGCFRFDPPFTHLDPGSVGKVRLWALGVVMTTMANS